MIDKIRATQTAASAKAQKARPKKTGGTAFQKILHPDKGAEGATAGITKGPQSKVAQTLRSTITDLEKQRARVDKLIAQASRGKNFSPGELIALQANVYRYSQEMEIFSRVVDRTISAAKTTLNTQV